MKIQLKHFGGCSPDEFLNALRRALKREKIETVDVVSVYLKPKIEKTIRLNLTKSDRPIAGTVDDDLTGFEFT